MAENSTEHVSSPASPSASRTRTVQRASRDDQSALETRWPKRIVCCDVVLVDGLVQVGEDLVRPGDGVLARPRLERVAERVQVGVRADPRVAEQVPRPADRVAALEDRVRLARQCRASGGRPRRSRDPAPTIRTSKWVLIALSSPLLDHGTRGERTRRRTATAMAVRPNLRQRACAAAHFAGVEPRELVASIADIVEADLDGRRRRRWTPRSSQPSRSSGADPTMRRRRSASSRGNVRRYLAVARRAAEPPPADVPPEALDFARTVVRRGIESDAIYQGYRRGPADVWRKWMSAAERGHGSGAEIAEVLDVSLELLFAYVDEVIGGVIAEIQREREQVLGGALARRAETIRLILDGAPLDPVAAGRRLAVRPRPPPDRARRLDGRGDARQGVLETTAMALARVAGGRPLTLAAGVGTIWGWIGATGRSAGGAPSDGAAVPPGVRVAVGTPSGRRRVPPQPRSGASVQRVMQAAKAGAGRDLRASSRSPPSPRRTSGEPRVRRRGRSDRLPRTPRPRRGCVRHCGCTSRRPRTRRARQSRLHMEGVAQIPTGTPRPVSRRPICRGGGSQALRSRCSAPGRPWPSVCATASRAAGGRP